MKKIIWQRIGVVLFIFCIQAGSAQILGNNSDWNASPYNWNNSPYNWNNSPYNLNSTRIIRDNYGNTTGYIVPKK